MLRPLDFFLAFFAIFGHAAIAIGFLNRAHSLGISRKIVKRMSLLAVAWLPLAPLIALAAYLHVWPLAAVRPLVDGWPRGWLVYLVPCWIVAGLVSASWTRRVLWTAAWRSVYLKSNHTRLIDVEKLIGGRVVDHPTGRFYARIPCNESWSIALNEKTLEIPRLSAALDGLSILHMSDFHFTGYVGKAFFREACKLAAEMRADLIALTGDFVDDAGCIDWIPETLGQLSAPLGVYFVMGNHDPRAGDMPRLRRALSQSDLIEVGGRWLAIRAGEGQIVLCGDALPWVGPAPRAADAPPHDTIGERDRPLRLLLAHTPDRLTWAKQQDFDLMLAGHTHGGQFRLPGIGPVLCPSRYGVYYAAGVFFEAPTVLHVSRGLSGQSPLRWNCRPEITKLILRR